MLSTLFSDPITTIISLFCLLVVITIHEFSHALAAEHLGDPTPRLQGRLSLNPIRHLDLLGTALILLIGFGWGKPVQTDPFNLRNPNRDTAIIAAAGPASNFILAIVLSILFYLFIFLKIEIFIIFASIIFQPLIIWNIFLGVFNLIPIYPLDGFNIVRGLLSEERAHEWNQLQRYGLIFLILLIFPFGNYSMMQMILNPITSFILSFLIPGFSLGRGIL